jgi:hypothetical protein
METVYIPTNSQIEEQDVYLNISQLAEILKKYKNEPIKIQFIAEMME